MYYSNYAFLDTNDSEYNSSHGINLSNSGNNTITDCYLAHQNGEGDNGLYLNSSGSNEIKDNTIISNSTGVYVASSTNNDINNNDINNNNTFGVHITSNSNTVEMNDIDSNTDYGVKLAIGASSNNIITNSFTDNNGSGSTWASDKVQAFDYNGNGSGNNWWTAEDDGNYWKDLADPTNNDYRIDSNSGADHNYDMEPLTSAPGGVGA